MSESVPIAATIEIAANGNVRIAPIDQLADEQMRALPRGVRLDVTVKVSKQGPESEHAAMLRRYMAGINLLFDAAVSGPGTEWPTPTHLRRTILKDLGFKLTYPRADGSVREEAQSMAIDRMPFDELKVCFELSRQYAVDRWGFDPWKTWEELHPLEPRP